MSSVDSMTSEWDVLVCVFAVFSHTVQLLGVIGSIHIEPSVVFHRCRVGHKMKSDNGLAFPLKNWVILPDACLSFLNRKAPTHHFLRI